MCSFITRAELLCSFPQPSELCPVPASLQEEARATERERERERDGDGEMEENTESVERKEGSGGPQVRPTADGQWTGREKQRSLEMDAAPELALS